jgi:hypothetical protein
VSYIPKLSALIKRTDDDWGGLDGSNLDNIIWYNINILDQCFYGIDLARGEMIGIQGPEKYRKSTLLANIIYSIAYQFIQKFGYWIAIDTLESGMPPVAYRDVLIAMGASRLLIANQYGSDRNTWPDIREIRQNPYLKNQLKINKDFLWYEQKNWTVEQRQVIEKSKGILSRFPVTIFGPADSEGNSRNLEETIKRWELLYEGKYPGAEGCSHRVFCCDNLQLYYGFGSAKFDQLEVAVAAHANFLVTHPGSVVIDISQLGKTSWVNSKLAGTEAYAKGGGALAAEVTVLMETEYDDKNSPDIMRIKVPRTRKKPPPEIIQEMDRESGAFLRPAYPVLG